MRILQQKKKYIVKLKGSSKLQGDNWQLTHPAWGSFPLNHLSSCFHNLSVWKQ